MQTWSFTTWLRYSLTLTCGVACLLTLSAGARAVCDNKGASESTGACYVLASGERTCAGAKDSTECNTNPVGYLWKSIKEDFPTDCVGSTGNNCNQPNADCYASVECTWDSANSKCVEVPNSYGTWAVRPKRTTAACDG